MKPAALVTSLILASIAFALDGQIGIHDPSTVVLCDGKYYTYGTGGSSLVSDDGWTWRRGDHASAPRPGARRHSHRRPLLRVCRREHRGAAQSRRQHDLEQDPRPGFPRLQMGRRRRGRLVGRRRRLQCHRSGRLSGSHRRQAVADLRFLFRLHPAGRTRSQDRQAPQPERPASQPRHQLRSVRHDLSRWLVLPAGHARQLLPRRRLRLQHPHGPRQESDRSLPRQRWAST